MPRGSKQAISLAALAVLSASLPAWAPAAALGSRRPVLCQHARGHTLYAHGAVRVYLSGEWVYGCLDGGTARVALWLRNVDHSGSVAHVDGRFVAWASTEDDQYAYATAVTVTDLRSGASYVVSDVSEPIASAPSWIPGPVERYVLAPDGRTARLYDTFTTSAANPDQPVPTGQVLDVVGFHGFHRKLASAGPGAIAPASIAYDGHTVTWTQGGSPASATL